MPPLEPTTSVAEREYFEFLNQHLGMATVLIAFVCLWLAKMAFHVKLSTKEIDAYSEQLAMQPDEVEALTPPLAKLLAKMKLPTGVRKQLVASGEYLGVLLVLGVYVERVATGIGEITRVHTEKHQTLQQAPIAVNGTGNGFFNNATPPRWGSYAESS